MIKLLLRHGDETRELKCPEDRITLGRSRDNRIPIPDKKTSRLHARIEKVDGRYRVYDLESNNGTLVNGEKVVWRDLARGDEIQIGLATLKVLDLDTPAPAPAPAVPAQVAADPAPESRPSSTPRDVEIVEAARRRRMIRTAVTVGATLLLVGGLGWGVVMFAQNSGSRFDSIGKNSRMPEVLPTRGEAEARLSNLRARLEQGPADESLVNELEQLARHFKPVYPAADHPAGNPFEQILADLRNRSVAATDELGRRVREALKDRRYGTALDALKAADPSQKARTAALLEEIQAEVRKDFARVDEAGRALEGQKRYQEAAEHYRTHAPRFFGTEFYKRLAVKPETLTEIARASEGPRPEPLQKPEEIAKGPTPEPIKPVVEPPKDPSKPEMEPPKKPEMEPPKKPEMAPPKPPAEPPAKPPGEPAPKVAVKLSLPKDVKNPCDVKKVVKGLYCEKCARPLDVDDVRRNVCKRCEEKPKRIDMCVRKMYQAECHPNKISEKPVS